MGCGTSNAAGAGADGQSTEDRYVDPTSPMITDTVTAFDVAAELNSKSWKSGFSSVAVAIEPDGSRDLDWMETSDKLGGFARLVHFPMIALAVSKEDKIDPAKTYNAPQGWHWASRVEVEKLLGGGTEVCPPARYYYRDQGGWDKITWQGVRRSCFVFQDTLASGGYLRSADRQGVIDTTSPEDMKEILMERFFAGIVCVEDGREAEVAPKATYKISVHTSDIPFAG